MKTPYLVLLFAVLFYSVNAGAQWQQSDIVRVTYICSLRYDTDWGFEIKANREMRMYNRDYDTTASQKFVDWSSQGTITMSADEFITQTTDTVTYTGKVPEKMYRALVDLIVQMPADTTSFFWNCCCDIPYETVWVYFKNSPPKKFMTCDGTNKAKVKTLLSLVHKIGFTPGYKKMPIDFVWDDLNKNK